MRMFIRSLIFKVLFYSLTTVFCIVALITLLLPGYRPVWLAFSFWMRVVLWMLKTIVHIHVDVRGVENIPKNTPCIVSPKHESTLDAVLSLRYVENCTALAKKEVFWFPFMGFLLMKLDIIPIDRGKGNAHQSLPDIGAFLEKSGRPILVFPEGTRVPIGKTKPLKSGAYHMHKEHHLNVYTGATNGGYFWPSDQFTMRSGTVIWEIHPAMPDGLDKEEFMEEMERRIIGRSAELKKDLVLEK